MKDAFSNHDFTLRQLQYAVAVADQLGFRKAAELCGVSQPSLSAQLAQLEEALGVELFERDTRRVMLTATGATIIELARKVLASADTVRQRARMAQDPFRSTWRIGVIPTLAPYLLPHFATPLRERFPELDLYWREEKTATLRQALEHGELDVALVALEAELGDLETLEVAKESFLFAGSPTHPLSKSARPEVSIEELGASPLLLLEDGHCLRDQALALCAHIPIHQASYRGTSLNTLAQMVSSGLGITLLPALSVATEARRTGIVTKPLVEKEASRTIGLVWRKSSPLQDAFARFGAFLRERLPESF
jgi:LysR family hydrogen peroxide-inducible transcriptional activator